MDENFCEKSAKIFLEKSAKGVLAGIRQLF
jgi:hypothetical protein